MKLTVKEITQGEVRHLVRSLYDDGSFCRQCDSNNNGWCKPKKTWCYKAKKNCDRNIEHMQLINKGRKKKKI